MRWQKHVPKILGVGLLACLLPGCVDQQASLQIQKVFLLSGSIEDTDQTVQCPQLDHEGEPVTDDEGNTETEEKAVPKLVCETEVQAGNVDTFRPQLSLNITDFDPSQNAVPGQIGPPASLSAVEDEDVCTMTKPSLVNKYVRHNTFETNLVAVNRLEPSDNVGAQSGSSGSGGFEGLELNQNDIQLNRINITFPDVSQASDLGLERTTEMTVVVEAGDGAITLPVLLFSGNQRGPLATLHEQLVLSRTNFEEYNESAQQTVVTVSANLEIEGETTGGTDVDSNNFRIPIQLCNHPSGCSTTPTCRGYE